MYPSHPSNSPQPKLKEVLPAHGVAAYERTLSEVLCKPKIMPIKSMALEKVEKIEKEAHSASVAKRGATAIPQRP